MLPESGDDVCDIDRMLDIIIAAEDADTGSADDD